MANVQCFAADLLLFVYCSWFISHLFSLVGDASCGQDEEDDDNAHRRDHGTRFFGGDDEEIDLCAEVVEIGGSDEDDDGGDFFGSGRDGADADPFERFERRAKPSTSGAPHTEFIRL